MLNLKTWTVFLFNEALSFIIYLVPHACISSFRLQTENWQPQTVLGCQFPVCNLKWLKIANFARLYYIRILQHFATKVWNITNFVMLKFFSLDQNLVYHVSSQLGKFWAHYLISDSWSGIQINLGKIPLMAMISIAMENDSINIRIIVPDQDF